MTFYKKPAFWAWALVFLAVGHKFYGIERPLLGHHRWRQADTAAIARNFAADGMNIARPAVDWGGAGPNYCETEFPLYSYAAALLYRVAGVHEWLGRVLALAAYALQLFLIYALGRRLFRDAGVALAAMFLFAMSPIAGFMARAFMPESWVLAASLGAAFLFLRWLDEERAGDLFGAAACLAVAAAMKLTAFHLLLWFGVLTLRYRRRALASPGVWLALGFVVAPVARWYYEAHQIYLRSGLTFGIWVAGDKWATLATLFSADFYRKMLVENIAANVLTAPGLLLALAGVVLLLRRRPGRFPLLTWLAAAVVYILILARGAYDHDYYSLPLVAPAALAGGFAVAGALRAWGRGVGGKAAAVATALVLAAAVPSFTGKFRVFVKVNEAPLAAGAFLAAQDPSGAPIVTFNDGGPQWLYYCRRKGWILSPKGPLATDAGVFAGLLERYEGEGARYLVVDMNYYGLLSNAVQEYLDRAHERLWLGDGFAVWRLGGGRAASGDDAAALT